MKITNLNQTFPNIQADGKPYYTAEYHPVTRQELPDTAKDITLRQVLIAVLMWKDPAKPTDPLKAEDMIADHKLAMEIIGAEEIDLKDTFRTKAVRVASLMYPKGVAAQVAMIMESK